MPFRKQIQYQNIAFSPSQIVASEDSWHQPWSEPVRVKIAGALAIALITSGLFAPPPYPKPNQVDNNTVSTQPAFSQRFQYQSYTRPEIGITSANPTFSAFTNTASSQVTFTQWMIYEPEFNPVLPPTAETVTIDKWNYAWSEPVRFRQLSTAQQHSRLQSQIPIEIITEDKWNYAWSEPVRQKAGLKSNLQQTSAGPVLQPSLIDIPESRTHQPWSEPVRTRWFAPAQQQAEILPPPQPTAAPTQQTAIISTVSVGIQYESRTQYQAVSQPTFVPQAVTPPVVTLALSSQVIFTKRLIYQGIAKPTFVPAEIVTVDKWFESWTDPVRQKPGLSTSLQQAFIGTVLNPETQITQNFESRWHYPWSEPVRFRQLSTAQQQSTIYQSAFFETINFDKWGYAWSEPVRQKPGLKTHLQQSFIATTLEPETQIIQTYESRWHFAWSEPVRIKPQVPAGEQQALIQGPVQTPEFITVDKWIYPWTDPVRQKIGLSVTLQQAFIAPVLNPETQITQNIESRWHYPWSEPVRFLRLSTAQQQSAAAPATSVFETVTIDKWTYPWSEPVRQKLGLKAHLQQALIATTLEPNTQIIQTYESRWHFAWSEPVRLKVVTANQPTFTWSNFTPTAAVNEDSWHQPWSEPVRQKPGLSVILQAAFTWSDFTPTIVDVSAVSGQPTFITRFQYQSSTATIFTPAEVITVDKWDVPLSEPVRSRRLTIALAAPAAIGPVLNPNTQISQFFESRWHYQWSEPVRKKPGLGAWLQRPSTLEAPPFPTFLRTIPWYRPLNEPVRLKIGLQSRLQQFFTIDTLPPPLNVVTLVLSATETNSDSAFFGVTVYNQAAPVVLPTFNTVVSIKEIEAVRAADISIEEEPEFDNAAVSIKEKPSV